MANVKITELTADTTPTGDDLIVTVNDPGGSPANRKVTIANLLGSNINIKSTTITATTVSGTSLSGTLQINDYQFFGIGWALDGTTIPDVKSTFTCGSKVDYRDFQGATADQDVWFIWQTPSDFAGNTFTYRGVLVITAATPPSNEGVVFGAKAIALASDETLNGTLGTAQMCSATGSPSRGDIWYTGWSATVSGTSNAAIVAGDFVNINFYRDQDNGSDTYAQKIGVVGIEIKYARALV